MVDVCECACVTCMEVRGTHSNIFFPHVPRGMRVLSMLDHDYDWCHEMHVTVS